MNTIKKYAFKPGFQHEFEIIDLNLLFNKLSKEKQIPHRADFYHIFWFQEGRTNHNVDFKSIEIKPNSLLFVNKNSVQFFDITSRIKGKVILFTDNFYSSTRLDTLFLKSTILFNNFYSIAQIDITNSIIKSIFIELEKEIKNKKDEYQIEIIRNNLKNLLLHSEREIKKQEFIQLKQNLNQEYALIFNELLENNFIKHKNVSFYVKQMSISAKKLNLITSKIYGKKPKSIIDDRVLLEVKRQLVYTNDSIKEIAYSLGFEELTNFIKYYRKHTGETPKMFREKYC